jgi:hypothetical protein
MADIVRFKRRLDPKALLDAAERALDRHAGARRAS